VRGVPPSVTRDDVIVHRVVVQGISARGERPQRVDSGGCVPRHAPYQHGARGFGSEERRADLAVREARREIRVRRRGEDDPGWCFRRRGGVSGLETRDEEEDGETRENPHREI